ncbi:Coenzyme F420 hydrogenase/dehydrogenase, beta subunit C-terminal domain [Leifsonia poae]|uniref:Coenzyme F420 hydrogenase/dehydrogenase, beta subunit C-terminal domain n=1 Tax=Leifsonia poae TaxID=110933 RepID=UPI001CBB21B0|nr:Coenzyme F420 hydrogenase/dehydrogenase, beta subunit C-terminal domain [Leifsonia poae]
MSTSTPTTSPLSAASVALDAAIDRVVRAGNCSGCGACALLDPGLEMRRTADGFLRPVRRGSAADAQALPEAAERSAPVTETPAAPVADAVARFDAACPGATVRAANPVGAVRHPTMGPVVRAWKAWATDSETRHRGSSGGALTAIAAWLLESGEAARMVGATAEPAEPRRTVSVTILSREQAIAAAGSRYAPTASAAQPAAVQNGSVFVGKPCEASAVRSLIGTRPAVEATAPGLDPVILSFFCAGTPSQHATDALVESLGVPAGEPLADLWYRGRGWPGRFTAVRRDGSSADASYDESWGSTLGPAVQWRCKVCADGVGESADITAADFWRADAQGYPVFAEGAGRSALIARTERGYDIVVRAVEAGVISVTPMNIDDLAGVQPLQTTRRGTLAGRLVGARLAGTTVPRYRGFSLTYLALPRLRETFRMAKGTFRRRRAASNTAGTRNGAPTP